MFGKKICLPTIHRRRQIIQIIIDDMKIQLRREFSKTSIIEFSEA